MKMRNLVIGFILGLVVATVGFSGLARMFDKGIDQVKTQSQELAK
jgi:capsular polysaccharide biosynthesis protein